MPLRWEMYELLRYYDRSLALRLVMRECMLSTRLLLPLDKACQPRAAMPRLLLCSPAAEGSRAVQLLQQRGLQLKVSGSTTADLVLPVRGGSLSFLLFCEADGNQDLVDRASLAARASRRTTVLWTGAIDHETVDETALALQNAWCLHPRTLACESSRPPAPAHHHPLTQPPNHHCRWASSPAGVTVLRCERDEEVAEHVLACEQRAAEDGAASAAQLTPEEVEDVIEGVHSHLAGVWGAEKHHVRLRERLLRCPQRLLLRHGGGWNRPAPADLMRTFIATRSRFSWRPSRCLRWLG